MATPRTVAFHTLGCKLNYSESSTIQRQFEDAGYGVNNFKEGADIFVINTCSVTDFADKKCRYIARKAKKTNPNAKVVMIGCYAQLKPKEISEIPEVDLVLGAGEKFNVLNYVDQLAEIGVHTQQVDFFDIKKLNHFEPSYSYGDRTRAFLKVQDGCDYKCSFCTIPLARGKSRSGTIDQILAKAKEIAALGVKEVVLTGVNIGDYGIFHTDGGKADRSSSFLELITELDDVDGIERFRISSIEPNLCSDEIIEFVAQSKRFMPHFHMPLQSGDDQILSDMRRRYRSDLYAERVSKIKSLMPHACIGVDVIVGFPTEDDERFRNSYAFVQELDISYLHVFTYSERNNTLAAEFADQVPMETRRERNEQLRILSSKKLRAHYEQHLGDSRNVLFEKSKQEGMITGFSDNYIKVFAPSEFAQLNSIEKVELLTIENDLMSIGAAKRIPQL